MKVFHCAAPKSNYIAQTAQTGIQPVYYVIGLSRPMYRPSGVKLFGRLRNENVTTPGAISEIQANYQ
jgi:hypothetical protein